MTAHASCMKGLTQLIVLSGLLLNSNLNEQIAKRTQSVSGESGRTCQLQHLLLSLENQEGLPAPGSASLELGRTCLLQQLLLSLESQEGPVISRICCLSNSGWILAAAAYTWFSSLRARMPKRPHSVKAQWQVGRIHFYVYIQKLYFILFHSNGHYKRIWYLLSCRLYGPLTGSCLTSARVPYLLQ